MTSGQEAQLQETLTAAYCRYMKELTMSALSKIHNHAVSEDLVQDTFMKTWLYLMKGGKIQMMRAFLYHILNNLIVDEYRKHKTASLDAIVEKGYEPGEDNSERLINTLDGEVAVASIRRLPKKYQKVIRMRYVKGLSLEEMSAIAGQSKNTLAVQAHRGLEKLRMQHHFA